PRSAPHSPWSASPPAAAAAATVPAAMAAASPAPTIHLVLRCIGAPPRSTGGSRAACPSAPERSLNAAEDPFNRRAEGPERPLSFAPTGAGGRRLLLISGARERGRP